MLRTCRLANLSVCVRVSVCRSVRNVYCGKTADWIRMPFGVGRKTGVLDGLVIVEGKEQFWVLLLRSCAEVRTAIELSFGAVSGVTPGNGIHVLDSGSRAPNRRGRFGGFFGICAPIGFNGQNDRGELRDEISSPLKSKIRGLRLQCFYADRKSIRGYGTGNVWRPSKVHYVVARPYIKLAYRPTVTRVRGN